MGITFSVLLAAFGAALTFLVSEVTFQLVGITLFIVGITALYAWLVRWRSERMLEASDADRSDGE